MRDIYRSEGKAKPPFDKNKVNDIEKVRYVAEAQELVISENVVKNVLTHTNPVHEIFPARGCIKNHTLYSRTQRN